MFLFTLVLTFFLFEFCFLYNIHSPHDSTHSIYIKFIQILQVLSFLTFTKLIDIVVFINFKLYDYLFFYVITLFDILSLIFM